MTALERLVAAVELVVDLAEEVTEKGSRRDVAKVGELLRTLGNEMVTMGSRPHPPRP